MSVTREDWAAYQQRHPATSQKSIERSIVNGVAVAMSELKGDPNWKLYCDHIEALKQQAEAQARRLEIELISGPVTADYLHYELKRQLAISKTRFETYTQCMQIVDSLIARGKPLTTDT